MGLTEYLSERRSRRIAATPDEWLVRTLAADWFFAEEWPDRFLAAQVLCDWCEDHGGGHLPPVVRFRLHGSLRDVVQILRLYGGRVGREKVSTVVVACLVLASQSVYANRNDRRVWPAGAHDREGAWFPEWREEAGDVIGRVKAPTAEYPYRYLRRCLTRQHCRRLVERGVCGLWVPDDVVTPAWFVRDQVGWMSRPEGSIERR